MWFRLTLALGHKSVKEAQRWISSSEFTEWCAYFSIEPFGSVKEDARAGTIAAAIYNVNRKKGHKAIKWSDIFPPYKSKEPKPWQELLAMVEDLNAAFGGKDLRKTPTA